MCHHITRVFFGGIVVLTFVFHGSVCMEEHLRLREVGEKGDVETIYS